MPDSWEEEGGDRGDVSLCAGMWWPLLSPASSGETMLTWLFLSTWGFINPLCVSLIFLSPHPPCFVFSDIPASLLRLCRLVLPWRLLQVPAVSAGASCRAVLPSLLLTCTSCVSAPGAGDPACCHLLCHRCKLRLCQGEDLGANSRGGRGKGLEEMGKAAPLLPAAAGLSPRSVSGWKGIRNGSDLGAALGPDGCGDPLLRGPGGCGKLVLAGEHCFVHLHTCLGISSTPFQPASDLGWKAVGLAPYTLTPAPLKPSPACFLGSLHFGAELWGLLPLPTWPVPELSPLGPSQGHPLGSSWGGSQWMQGWAEHTPKPLYSIKSAGGSRGTLQSENSVTGNEGCPQTLSYVLG